MRFTILLGALVAVALPSSAWGAVSVPALPVPVGAAMILNAGSDDLAGYRIVVLPSGKTTAIDGAGRWQGQVPADLADRFFRDLTAAMPLTQLASGPCAKAPSAPLPTTVSFQGQNSADVSCRADDKSSALSNDAQAIARALYISNYRVSAMRFLFGSGAQYVPVSASATAPPSSSSGGYGTGY